MAKNLEFAALIAALLFAPALRAQEPQATPPPAQRFPRQLSAASAAIQGFVHRPPPAISVAQPPVPGAEQLSPVVGATVQLLACADSVCENPTPMPVVDERDNRVPQVNTNADGIFRMVNIPPGRYRIRVGADTFESFQSVAFDLAPGKVETFADVEGPEGRKFAITLQPAANQPPPQPYHGIGPPPGMTTAEMGTYLELPREKPVTTAQAELPSPENQVYVHNRWDLNLCDNPDFKAPPDCDEGRRYDKPGEYQYTKSHLWDPFDRSKLKGDYPIIGKRTFFIFTAVSSSFADGRRLPIPSGISAQNPGSYPFFGAGGEGFINQTVRLTVELNHGDASFRPPDWRIVFTPAFNVNFLDTQQNGIVNIDVLKANERFDSHIGLQEGFFEYKLHDLSPNFDFVSLRVGIQQFTSDFRGFLFVEEQPGARLFGNLRSNRYQYNLAYFYFLEKDSNSLLNTFQPRHQQVAIANLFIQDFLFKGYTTEFSYHYNWDQADFRFDTDNFLVRPAPVANFRPHTIRADYAGWTSNGHIGRINVSSAFYQAFGYDTYNALLNSSPVTIDHFRPGSASINAHMGALELSLDKSWVRFRTSVFYASGDSHPDKGPLTGFDTIVDSTSFAGGIFSFFDRESFRLTGTGVALNDGSSLLPSLRTQKFEGQANFDNPGVGLGNVGADFDVLPKVRTFLNANFLRFMDTEPLELLLFQKNNIDKALGGDYSAGVKYRPPLTENMELVSGVSMFTPWTGFRQIYTSQTLFSVFASLRLKF